MAKKSTVKTTAKKTAAKTTKKKTPATIKKHKAKPKASPFKSKLGHDPLAWITGEEASDLGVSFDDIDAKVDTINDQIDQILPPSEALTPVEMEPVTVEPAAKNIQHESEPESIDSDDGSWGLFGDDEPAVIETKIESVDSDDGSWGLFGDDSEDKPLPVGEGVAWGLFADENATDTVVDHDAITVHLPSAFNVAEISKIYHEFDEQINKDHDVVVDASDVETIDATGLQLLFACQKELQRRGCKMIIKDASAKAELLSSSSFINELLGMAG